MVAPLVFVLVAGCAALTPVDPGPWSAFDTGTGFDAAGRLSARRGNDGIVANFTWRHELARDRIDVATPTGQTLAQMAGDSAGVRLTRPGEPAVDYSDWDALTREVFGAAIPVTGLASWVVGRPVPEREFGLERDAAGRPLVLNQGGWEIVYTYADGAPAYRPFRLVMRYPDVEPVEVRVVLDRIGPIAP